MTRLRTRLIVAFVAATVLPLAATIWITTSLLDRSLGYATTEELDTLSRTLESAMRRFYERERQSLKDDAASGRLTAVPYAARDAGTWPEAVRSFWDSGEPERFTLALVELTDGGLERPRQPIELARRRVAEAAIEKRRRDPDRRRQRQQRGGEKGGD